jgi:16S rRNA (guanine966-N2)-methyltransferase
VRVIAGALKGRRLVTPRGSLTRPTADQVRIALMDALMPWLPGARFLDLFAGAGGVGIDGLSRGAIDAVLVERDRRAAAALRENVEALGLAGVASVLQMDVQRALARLAAEGQRFDVVFLDPPYDTSLVPDTLAQLGSGCLIRQGGVVVAQHLTKRAPVLMALPALERFRARRFGETTLTFFRAGG